MYFCVILKFSLVGLLEMAAVAYYWGTVVNGHALHLN
jgi:hypothetical protein